MKTRSSSAPKLQVAYTPRVKDGRLSNDSPQKHYYGMTAPRFNPNPTPQHFHNPENTPLKGKQPKEAQEHVAAAVARKISLDPAPQEGRLGRKAPAAHGREVKRSQQQTIHGRRLEYPAAQRANNCREEGANQSIELMKSSSLSSQHFIDRGIKSATIKSRKQEFEEKFQVAFGYLLDTNEAYLAERRRACNQKARPKEELFKIERPLPNTTSQDHFYEKEAAYDQQFEAQNLKTANSFGPAKVCGNSTTNEFHDGRQGPRADLAHWPDRFKLQGPLYGVTTHANHFPHPGTYDKMVPVAKFNEHPMGFAHRTNSTHRTFHKGEHTDPAQLATWNNLHPYGNGFDPHRGTTYSQQHGEKQLQPTQVWPMYEPELIRSEGKFSTEHQSNLVNHYHHELNGPNYCECGRKVHKH